MAYVFSQDEAKHRDQIYLLTLFPEATKKPDKYMRQWFSSHLTSGSEGKWSLKKHKQTNTWRALQVLYSLEKVPGFGVKGEVQIESSSLWVEEVELGVWESQDS